MPHILTSPRLPAGLGYDDQPGAGLRIGGPAGDPLVALLLSLGGTAWYSAQSITSPDQQTLPNLLDPDAEPARFGSTSGSDTSDPVRNIGGPIGFDGTDDYIQLPSSDTPTFTAGAGAHTHVVVVSLETAGALVDFSTSGAARVRSFIGPGLFRSQVIGATDSVIASAGLDLSGGSPVVGGMRVDDGAMDIYTSSHGVGAEVDITGAGALTNNAGRFGVAGYLVGGSLFPGMLYEIALFRDTALTDEAWAAVSGLLQSRWA